MIECQLRRETGKNTVKKLNDEGTFIKCSWRARMTQPGMEYYSMEIQRMMRNVQPIGERGLHVAH
jgi:hypothetical protein